MFRRLILAAACLAALLLAVGVSQTSSADATTPDATAPYKDARLPVERRADDLLSRLTAAEKARLLAGSGWMESSPIERLGIPAIKMADGPMGVRNWTGSSAITNVTPSPVLTTSFPASVGIAASWDTELVHEQARVIAQEVKALGRDMILAPTVNIQRTPLWGRNFEGYGEDPYLAARMGVAYVSGVQQEGVIPSVKHFAANNEEYERHRIDETIDARTLHEIYFPAFRAAVEEAGAWAVMNAYNKVNGQYCAESALLLRDTLRRRWGFKGFVISDWGSTYSTAATINAGMNLEMPGGEPMRRWFARPETQKAGNGAGWLSEDKVLAAVAWGEVQQATIDSNVRDILRVMFKAGLFDRPHVAGGEVDTAEQRAVARRAATESIVLLRNEGGVLPLDPAKVKSLAVIGPCSGVARTGGGGSSLVRPRYTVTALEGLREAAGAGVQVSHALGAAMPGEDAPADAAALRDEAVALAAKADAAIVVVGYSFKLESEGFDRASLDLPAGQDELVRAVAAANRHTIVVVVAGAPVDVTRWLGDVRALLFAAYGGQEAGHGIGDIVFGRATPGGKLPFSYPRRIEDSTAHGHYPGQDLHVSYAEGIYVGYRGFDKRDVEPLYPFGFGLSYASFEYEDLALAKPRLGKGEGLDVSLKVRNTSTRPGAEVVQLYLKDVQASLDRPEKELKGFRRVELAAGETKTVHFSLDTQALSFFDPKRDDWVAEPGAFEVLVGASSRDIRLRGGFELVD
jgi:beta-glucosidase